jgi:hypothetical protein
MSATVQGPDGRALQLEDTVLAPFEARVDGAASLPRRCFAAAHVTMLPGYAEVAHSVERPGTAHEIAAHIDWEATMAFRERIDRCGMGVAEAMDTAQRFELGWDGARALIERTGALGLENGFVGAASTDQLATIPDLDALAGAMAEQVRFVRGCGGIPILLPQPWLTGSGAGEEEFVRFYTDVIDASEGEVLLHYLGEMFHPSMRGYFPGDSLRRVLTHDPEKVRGLKLSLLDRELEETLRAELAPRGQVILTGDDYNFAALIEGQPGPASDLAPLGGRPLAGGPFSHALLGIFAAVTRPASVALRLLDAGDVEGYRELMGRCERLGRVIFEAPVQRYKSGIAFLAWLNGLQENRMLANHEEHARSLDYYLRVAEAASFAGAIEDAELATGRLAALIENRAG